MVENNVNLKSNSSDIYFKICYATMLCGLGLPSVNFAPKKLCALPARYSAKISDFLSKPGRIFKFSRAVFASWAVARLPKELFVCTQYFCAHKV